MKPKTKIHEIDRTNDKKYLGPLTYQHFRIAGWLLIALSQIAVILSIGQKMHEEPKLLIPAFCGYSCRYSAASPCFCC